MNIHELRKKIGREEFDYGMLISCLSGYKQPRKKISNWLKTGDLIRVKKGIYIFGASASRGPYHKELLANWIYGPSAISLDYALSYYGIIPERVETITSITPKRYKKFNTPVGNFTYSYLNLKKYSTQIIFEEINDKEMFIIASPEKSLVDKLYFFNIKLENIDQINEYLIDDLRIEINSLTELSLKNIIELAQIYNHKNVTLLLNYLKKLSS